MRRPQFLTRLRIMQDRVAMLRTGAPRHVVVVRKPNGALAAVHPCPRRILAGWEGFDAALEEAERPQRKPYIVALACVRKDQLSRCGRGATPLRRDGELLPCVPNCLLDCSTHH